MILVCGATGTIGGQVIQQFVKAAIPVTALLRKLPSEKSPLPESVACVIGDMAEKQTLPAALRGVEKLFLLSAVGDHQAEQEEDLLAAAAKSGVSHVVKLSVMGAADDAPHVFGKVHARVESALRNSGMQWTMLRPNMLMQNLRWYQAALAQGSLPLPLKQAAVSHVDASDVAAVAFRALIEDGHAGKAYTLTGPEALTGDDVAGVIGLATHRAIRYESIPMSDFRAFLEKMGESPLVVGAEAELFDVWSRGAGSAVTTTIEDITGRKPTSLAEFAAQHAAELT